MIETSQNILLLGGIKLIYPWILILANISESLINYWVIFGAPAQNRWFSAPRFRPFYPLELSTMIETSQDILLLGGIKILYPWILILANIGESLINHWVIFGAPAPILKIFCLHISPFLSTGASQNDRYLSKYAVTGWNQSYIPMTTHFGKHRRLFGKLLSDFSKNSSSTSPLGPQKPLFWAYLRSQTDFWRNLWR